MSLIFKWWLKPGLNRRHTDFQSVALPTELPSLKKMAVQTGIEPAVSSVTGRHVNRYTTGPSYLKWLRGKDLNFRPPGYEPDELPDCSTPRCKSHNTSFFNGGGRGIRTPAPLSRSVGFQDRSLQPLGYSSKNICWWTL